MSYGLIYTIPFASLRNKSCIIEIEKEGYVGAPTELVGAGNPFTVDIDDDDFLYVPSRFSTANIRIVGSGLFAKFVFHSLSAIPCNI
ncbi:hypothetical protein NXW67_22625 [Bacteroides fragilis]|nr:hypothetical protein [Bacteroides fragilis]